MTVRETEKRSNLININTSLYAEASAYTLEEFKEMAIDNFEQRILKVINLYEARKSESSKTKMCLEEYEDMLKIEKSMYDLSFYSIFNNIEYYIEEHERKYYKTHHFKINPKNINFESCVTNIYDYLPTTKERPLCDSNSEEIKLVEEQKSYICLKDIPKWKELFGKGEFPFMTIQAFRLGNTEYFCYHIHR